MEASSLDPRLVALKSEGKM
jgi:hypothetical protein